ncbi:MAG: tetratricopeptide repeat protein [Bacteroidota bacterium]
MKLLKPFKSEADPEAYRRHRQALQFWHVVGEGIKQVDHTLRDGFDRVEDGLDRVEHGQVRIHQALLGQTEVIRQGFFGLELSLESGFDQMADKLDQQTEATRSLEKSLILSSKQIEEGLSGLKASLDMGMVDIVSQFELQRNDIQQGFERLADLLENSRKTLARERYLDGKQAYERYEVHPDESQFMTDARDYLLESVEIYRGNPFCHLYLGHIYQDPGHLYDLERALEHYQLTATYAKGLDNKALAALGYFLAAWISYVLGDVDQAIALAQKALEYDPKGIPENYYNLARFHAHKQQSETALQYLDKAVQDFDPHYTLKAEIDEEFQAIRPALDQYFEQIRSVEAAHWDEKLRDFQLLPPPSDPS